MDYRKKVQTGSGLGRDPLPPLHLTYPDGELVSTEITGEAQKERQSRDRHHSRRSCDGKSKFNVESEEKPTSKTEFLGADPSRGLPVSRSGLVPMGSGQDR